MTTMTMIVEDEDGGITDREGGGTTGGKTASLLIAGALRIVFIAARRRASRFPRPPCLRNTGTKVEPEITRTLPGKIYPSPDFKKS